MTVTQLRMSFALGILGLFHKASSQMYGEVECVSVDHVIRDCQTLLPNTKYFQQ